MNVNTTYVLDGVQNFRILQRLRGCIERRKVVSRSRQDLIYCIMGPGSLRAHLVDSSHKFIFKMSSDS